MIFEAGSRKSPLTEEYFRAGKNIKICIIKITKPKIENPVHSINLPSE